MKFKTKNVKEYKLTLSAKELDAVSLAIALMLNNEHTHENWIDLLEPVLWPMREALGLDEDYGI